MISLLQTSSCLCIRTVVLQCTLVAQTMFPHEPTSNTCPHKPCFRVSKLPIPESTHTHRQAWCVKKFENWIFFSTDFPILLKLTVWYVSASRIPAPRVSEFKIPVVLCQELAHCKLPRFFSRFYKTYFRHIPARLPRFPLVAAVSECIL